jgi:acetyl-CoA carboxylase alpha subunit
VPTPASAPKSAARAAKAIDEAIGEALRDLLNKTPGELIEDRYQRFRSLGAFVA